MISRKRGTRLIKGGERNLPSVMDLQAKYKTTTAAVSSKVATKEPSTFELVPYEKNFSNLVAVVNLKKHPMLPRRSLD